MACASLMLKIPTLEISPLKKPGSEEMCRVNDEGLPEFRRFRIVYHKDCIRDGFNRLDVIFSSSDVLGMIEYALTKARLEGIL